MILGFARRVFINGGAVGRIRADAFTACCICNNPLRGKPDGQLPNRRSLEVWIVVLIIPGRFQTVFPFSRLGRHVLNVHSYCLARKIARRLAPL